MAMTELLDFLLMLSISSAIFTVPAAVLALLGKIFKIESIEDAFRW